MSLAAACRRDPPEPAAIALPAELAAYTKFQPGTWWVYQDSATAARDSVWVVECRSYVQRYGKAHDYPDDKFEQFEMRTASSREAGQIKYTVNHSCPMSDRTNGQINGQSRPCWDVKRGVYAPNGAGDAGYAFVFPYEALRGQDQTVYEFRGSSYIYWHTTPQAVGDTSYADVLQVRLAYDASEGRRVGYEWARNVGIVRRRIEASSSPPGRRPGRWCAITSCSEGPAGAAANSGTGTVPATSDYDFVGVGPSLAFGVFFNPFTKM